VSLPTIRQEGDSLVFEWDIGPARVQAEVEEVHHESSGWHAEIQWLNLSDEVRPLISAWKHINLSSPTTVKSHAKSLQEITGFDASWDQMIEQIAARGIADKKKGQEFETIGGARILLDRIYRLAKLLEENQITILFGEGESCKSTLALAIALSVQTGVPLLGLEPLQGNVLYLDWETDGDEHHRRLAALWHGLSEVDDVPEIPYRRMEQPLVHDLGVVKRFVSQNSTRLVIIDSAGFAMGREPEKNDSAIQLLTAARQLQTTILCLDHESKDDTQKEPNKRRAPFGGIYKINMARSVYEIRAVPTETRQEHINLISTALYHTKSNNGRKQPVRGYRITFDETEDKTLIAQSAVADVPELEAGMRPIDRLRNCLKRGYLPVHRVVELTNLKENYVRATFSDGVRRGTFRKNEKGEYGLPSLFDEDSM